VVSPHNAYYFWRGEAAGRDVVVSVAVAEAALARDFAETRRLATFRCRHCAHFRPDLAIALSTGPRRPLEELLAEWRHFGRTACPALVQR
jgi:hypothetical protein